MSPPTYDRTTIRMDPDTLDRVRHYAYWNRTTIQAVLTTALNTAMNEAESRNGGPFPALPGGMTQLPVGRPLRQGP